MISRTTAGCFVKTLRRWSVASLTYSGVWYMAMYVAPSTICKRLSRLPARLKASWLNQSDPALLPAMSRN
jgi:hypothetical protein